MRGEQRVEWGLVRDPLGPQGLCLLYCIQGSLRLGGRTGNLGPRPTLSSPHLLGSVPKVSNPHPNIPSGAVSPTAGWNAPTNTACQPPARVPALPLAHRYLLSRVMTLNKANIPSGVLNDHFIQMIPQNKESIVFMIPKHTSEDASFTLCSKLQIRNTHTPSVPQFPRLLNMVHRAERVYREGVFL